jgi:hypothetical protein
LSDAAGFKNEFSVIHRRQLCKAFVLYCSAHDVFSRPTGFLYKRG